MKNIFNSIKLMKPKKNRFDLSHDVKLSCDMGNLVPVLAQECVPGDSFKIGCQSMIRFAPLVAPVMHRMNVTIHYFFVPNRILWDNWEKFIVDPSTPLVAPYIRYTDSYVTTPAYQKFLDYMGIPPIQTGGTATNLNPFAIAAYQCIYNEYYRDQNLVTEVDYKLRDGLNNATSADDARLFTLRRRAYMHDYFTASLPFAQKGDSVEIPLGEITLNPDWEADGERPQFEDGFGNVPIGGLYSGDATNGPISVLPSDGPLAYNPDGSLRVDNTSINDLRRAFRLQEFLEKNARGGTRYIENILTHFGVKSSDKRLQRPEYITGVKSPVVVSEVLNTTGETAGLPQGNMAGHAVSVQGGKSGSYYCEEHGYIIGIMSVMPLTAYQQGIPKHYTKLEPLDYFWPSFANIGEQEVKNKELYAYSPTGDETFGYVPRYADYKFNNSRVAGDFRTSLDYWHLGRIFASQPALNKTFIECDPASTKRIFAVTDPDADSLYCHIYHDIQAVRPMPVFGTPTI